VILPALEEGAVVLCDRYTDSSEAYQGAGRGLGAERILAMHEAVCHGVQPGLTVLLLPPLEASLHRARRRNERSVRLKGTDENRFEREGDAFYTRVYDQYRALAAREPQRVFIVDGEGTIDAIAQTIWGVVQSRLGEL
jgi:dTMP kinase